MATGSFKQFNTLLDVLSRSVSFYGLDTFSKDFNPRSKLLVSSIIFISTYALFTFYTMAVVSTDFIDIAFCLTTFGIYIQGVFKIFVAIYYRDWLLKVSGLIHDMYNRAELDVEQRSILELYGTYCWKAFRAIKILYYTVGCFMVAGPLVLRLCTSTRTLPFAIYLPYLDADSSPGYEVTFCYMLLIIAIAVCGFTFSDTFFIAIMIMALGQLKVIMHMLWELDQDLTEQLYCQHEIQAAKLKRICQEHKSHIEFKEFIGRVVDLHSVVVVSTAAAALVICLVVLVKENWYFGLFLIGVAFYEMFQIFLLGTFYEITCMEFVRKLYGIQWNKLSPPNRGILRVILQMAQLPNLSTLGGIAPSNLNTFLQVIKQIYTLLMLLLRYAD